MWKGHVNNKKIKCLPRKWCLVTFNHSRPHLAFNGSSGASTLTVVQCILFQHRLAWVPAQLSWRNKKSGISTSLHEAWRIVPMCISPSFLSLFSSRLCSNLLSGPLSRSHLKRSPSIKRAYFYLLICLKFAKIEGTLRRPNFSYWEFPERFCKDCKKVSLVPRVRIGWVMLKEQTTPPSRWPHRTEAYFLLTLHACISQGSPEKQNQ